MDGSDAYVFELDEVITRLKLLKEYPDEPPYNTSDCPHDSTWLDGWDSAIDKAIEMTKEYRDQILRPT